MITPAQKRLGISAGEFRVGNRLAARSATFGDRSGAVAVEFAIVAPVLVAVVFGMIQYGRAFEMQNQLQVAAREGARFASMDHTGMLANGQSTNQKLVEDVKNFLATYGIDKNDVTVEVKDHANPSADFNLDDPNNDLKLFDVRVSVNYSQVSWKAVSAGSDYVLSASVVFRNGRATISQ
jgi:Flp pilus assembly protein TadG